MRSWTSARQPAARAASGRRTGAPPPGRRRASSMASASRDSAPTGVFSSWLTLATKSRRTASTRRASVRSSTSSRTSAEPSGATRAPHDEPVAGRAGRGGSSSSTSRISPSRRTWRGPASSSSGRTRPAAADQAERVRAAGLAVTTGRPVEDDGRGPQHREHVGDAGGAAPAGALRRRGTRRCCALAERRNGQARRTAPTSDADQAAPSVGSSRQRPRRPDRRRATRAMSRPRHLRGSTVDATVHLRADDRSPRLRRLAPDATTALRRRTTAMRDAFHEELDEHHRPAGRDDPAGRVGDQPGHDRAAGRRPGPRRERDRGRRRRSTRCATSSTRVASTCWPASSRSPPTCGSIVTTLRMSADLERMGDLAQHVAKVARLRFPPAVPAAAARDGPRDGPGRRAAGRQGRRGHRLAGRRRGAASSSATTTRWTGCTASCSRDPARRRLDRTASRRPSTSPCSAATTSASPTTRSRSRAGSSTWSPASGTTDELDPEQRGRVLSGPLSGPGS